MHIGPIGAANLAQAVAQHLLPAGHEAAFSNSRGPESLFHGDVLALRRHVGRISDHAGIDKVLLQVFHMLGSPERDIYHNAPRAVRRRGGSGSASESSHRRPFAGADREYRAAPSSRGSAPRGGGRNPSPAW